MQPLAMFPGVVMGSVVSIAVGLLLTLIVMLLLPEHADRFGSEFGPMFRALGGTLALVALSAAAFYGELRVRSWRRAALAALFGALALAAWFNWPTG